ncbi:MAG: hypothetical protein ACK4TN_00915, partial [Brevinematales bacterium]
MIQLPAKVRQDINQWYSRGEPFLFAVDYRGERALAWRLSEVPGESVLYKIGGYTNREKRQLS